MVGPTTRARPVEAPVTARPKPLLSLGTKSNRTIGTVAAIIADAAPWAILDMISMMKSEDIPHKMDVIRRRIVPQIPIFFSLPFLPNLQNGRIREESPSAYQNINQEPSDPESMPNCFRITGRATFTMEASRQFRKSTMKRIPKIGNTALVLSFIAVRRCLTRI